MRRCREWRESVAIRGIGELLSKFRGSSNVPMSFVTVAMDLMGLFSSISNSSIRNYTGPLARTPMIDFTLILGCEGDTRDIGSRKITGVWRFRVCGFRRFS